ncbi:hypothetical protein E4U41_000782 [Claviceps citrina]|nr:hypothetical protein E4U41_000782 [Claviceps citrina]
MKFTTPLALLCAVSSSARGLVVANVRPRDLSSSLAILADVRSNIDALDAALRKPWTNDPTPLLGASNGLIASLAHGKDTISAGPALGLADAVKLVRPVKELQAHAQALLDSLRGDKPQIRQARLCDVVARQVDAIDGDGEALTKAIVDKVPDTAQHVAAMMSQGLLDILTEAKKEFSAGNC